MSAPLLKIGLLLLVPLVALVFFLGAYFFFYRGGYDAPPIAAVSFDRVIPPVSSHISITEVPELHPGLLLVDGGHRNDFTKGEISSLLARVASRGHEIEFIGDADLFGDFRRPDPQETLLFLKDKLRRADSLAVIAPDVPYTREEVGLVKRFVEKGGRLLLMADPTRDNRINTLAERFGITFQPDYLYNTVDYDLNFRNIFISSFRPDQVTQGLRQIALYTSGSLKSSSPWLAYTDANTRSSIVERIEPFYPIIKGADGRVLAIYDLTFMVPPQNSILDNDILISNIADFLTVNERRFDLVDFPYFFQDDVDILLGRSSLFDAGTAMKASLDVFQIGSNIVGVEDITKDTVYLGLYEDASDVAQYLAIAGIRVDSSLRTPFTPDIDREGTAFILLHSSPERNILAILGNSQAAIADMMDRLNSGTFRAGLVSDFVGVYRAP